MNDAPGGRGRAADDGGRSEVRYLTLSELAARTTFSVSTLRRLVKAGRLVPHQPGGPRHRMVFPVSAIEQVRPSAPSVAAPPPAHPPAAEPSRGPHPLWDRRR